VHNFILKFQGQKLEDDRTLDSYNITDNAILDNAAEDERG
jgi:hypothetical protein